MGSIKFFPDEFFENANYIVPESIELIKTLEVKHDPLTLLPPQFETPMPQL